MELTEIYRRLKQISGFHSVDLWAIKEGVNVYVEDNEIKEFPTITSFEQWLERTTKP